MELKRKRGFYEKYIKRLLDIICSLLTIILFGWLYLLIFVVVRVKMDRPVILTQIRPGIINPRTGKEKLFKMYKFRTMTNKCGDNGELLPDEQRLEKFGRWIRSTSLDELPEVINILKGDMSVIGPRPQLVRDMVFMNDEVRMRHTAKPGLSGLAQVMGRNAITWEEKFTWDLEYIENISLWNDVKILWMTVIKVFFNAKDVEAAETDVTLDYGDELLNKGIIDEAEYDDRQKQAKIILETLYE